MEACEYCGAEVSPEPGSPTSKEYDHKKSWVNGGASDATNICISCRTDNRKKGRMSDEEYKKKLANEGLLTPKNDSP